jgi:hypothetical protein
MAKAKIKSGGVMRGAKRYKKMGMNSGKVAAAKRRARRG